MKALRSVALLLGVAMAPGTRALAQDSGGSPATEAFPYVGEITGDSVNLRAQNSESAWSLRKLEKGERVVVLAESASWFKVRVPLGFSCWISSAYASKGSDGYVTITTDRVNLRPAPSLKQFPLQQLDTGTKLRLISESEEWVEVAAPEDLPVWVSASFVSKLGSEESFRGEIAQLKAEADRRHEARRAEAAKLAESAAREKEIQASFNKAEDLLTAENAKSEPDYAAALALYGDVKEKTQDASLRETTTSRIVEIGRLQRMRTELSQAKDVGNRLEGELQATRKRYEEELEGLKRVVEHERRRSYEIGWLVRQPNLNLLDKTSPAFKLTKGGTTVCYVESTKYNLSDFVEKQVMVSGDIRRKPDLDSRLVVVKDLEVVSGK